MYIQMLMEVMGMVQAMEKLIGGVQAVVEVTKTAGGRVKGCLVGGKRVSKEVALGSAAITSKACINFNDS